jgi:hypothetical protein
MTRLLAAAMVLATVAADASAQSRRERGDRPEQRGERDSEGRRGDGAAAPAPAPPQAGRAARLEDEYKVLLERSIFARSGTAAAVARPPSTTSTAPAAPQLSPEQAVVFIGVIAQDEEYVAFAENQVTRQIMVLRNGDDVARGKVVAITLDSIAYGTGGAIKEIHLGQNLAGEVVASSFTSGGSYAGGTPSTGPSAAPSTAGMSPDQAAVLERLRQRRQRGE